MSHALDFATSLAKDAGALIRENFALGVNRTWKDNDTPLTVTDTKINDLVLARVHESYPNDSIRAEEGSDLSRSQSDIWVCDPLDGTFPFMHGIPVSTFTLARVVSGVPILGVIYDPFTDRLFAAEKGAGATLNGQKINTRKISSLKNESVGVVFWKGNMNTMNPFLKRATDAGAKIFDLVSIAYMDAMVASGELAATVFPGESAHDSAAAKIVVEEAGGLVTSMRGEDQRYDREVQGHIAAAGAAVHAELLRHLGL